MLEIASEAIISPSPLTNKSIRAGQRYVETIPLLSVELMCRDLSRQC